ncbi:hypothetical protein VOLCADRAFT_99708 [Volvox carteri f. nagariensis]|uniref:Uncharacterized protein n=1 Tax=Volvox carteri f. nagariensis TaxID=3068 RepID=D8UIF6_VOLCA|nr:uncharacterized protein VOLCADRAFT_99708 [Volvox carteri f. nagariensis]EFJ40501.1 hypothetical protein VOLCADRAFT_99708 [Volvox carteri f. nagariensis]|eukprot:XP_002958425.1 hypothetical protein VOLCADRAFT_99708 [Volvox carteri f. nagariensis]
MLMHKTSGLSIAHRQRRVVYGGWPLGSHSRWSRLGSVKANKSDTQISTSVQPPAASPAIPQEAPTTLPQAPIAYRSIASLSSVASLSSLDDYQDETASFRFLPSQLEVFNGLAISMQNCSRGLAALAFGSVVMDAFEVVEHAHQHVEHAVQHAVQAAVETGASVATAHGSQPLAGGLGLLQEVVHSVSLTDVAFCVNEIIPALLIAYAAVPFQQLSQNPDEPHMALALKGVGRLSVTLQQLAWTSGSVAVVLLLTAAAEYPPIVGWASWSCLALSMARGAALWWVIAQHTTSGAEVARTLAELRGLQGGREAEQMNVLDRAASWLALGVLLQVLATLALGGGGNSRLSRTQNLITCALLNASTAVSSSSSSSSCSSARLAEGVGENSNGWVSSVILAAQKAANATALFTSAAALDRALHNDGGYAGSVALLVPSLEESPLGVLLGDGVMHISADLLVEVMEAL